MITNSNKQKLAKIPFFNNYKNIKEQNANIY